MRARTWGKQAGAVILADLEESKADLEGFEADLEESDAACVTSGVNLF